MVDEEAEGAGERGGKEGAVGAAGVVRYSVLESADTTPRQRAPIDRKEVTKERRTKQIRIAPCCRSVISILQHRRPPNVLLRVTVRAVVAGVRNGEKDEERGGKEGGAHGRF